MIVIKEFCGNVLKFGLDELELTAELAQRNATSLVRDILINSIGAEEKYYLQTVQKFYVVFCEKRHYLVLCYIKTYVQTTRENNRYRTFHIPIRAIL